MHKLVTGFAFAAALALCGGSASAVDQQITGKKLLIVNPGGGPHDHKIVYLSKDATIALPFNVAEDPRCVPDGGSGAGGVLTVSSTASGESATIPLTCAGWSANSAGTAYKFRDPLSHSCRIVFIKGGKLQKAVCKPTAIQYNLGVDQVSVDVLLRTGTAPRRWCTSFNAAPAGCDVVKNGVDGKRYLAKNCTMAAVACGASSSGAFLNDIVDLF